MRQFVKQLFRGLGYKVCRLAPPPEPGALPPTPAPGSVARPVGDMWLFLEDLRARGLAPRSVLDVGANKGDWSRLVKLVFPAADCFLVEPQAEMKPPLVVNDVQRRPGSAVVCAGPPEL